MHLFGITGTPWNLSGTTDGAEEPTVIELLPPSEVDQTDNDAFETRGFHIKREILETYGFTLGCPKCTAMRRGESKRKGHNDACRIRITEEMKKDPEHNKQVEEAKLRKSTEETRNTENEEKGKEAKN